MGGRIFGPTNARAKHNGIPWQLMAPHPGPELIGKQKGKKNTKTSVSGYVNSLSISTPSSLAQVVPGPEGGPARPTGKLLQFNFIAPVSRACCELHASVVGYLDFRPPFFLFVLSLSFSLSLSLCLLFVALVTLPIQVASSERMRRSSRVIGGRARVSHLAF